MQGKPERVPVSLKEGQQLISSIVWCTDSCDGKYLSTMNHSACNKCQLHMQILHTAPMKPSHTFSASYYLTWNKFIHSTSFTTRLVAKFVFYLSLLEPTQS
jgi:hypothetical protein